MFWTLACKELRCSGASERRAGADSAAMMIVPANNNCAEGLPIRLRSQPLFCNQPVDLVTLLYTVLAKQKVIVSHDGEASTRS